MQNEDIDTIETEFGPQYSEDNEFKRKARLHQSKYRKYLHADFSGYGNRLAEKDALQGMNFYSGLEGLFEEVKKRYRLKYTPLYYDMLRSEHIPFNFFIPFKYFRQLGKDILNHFMEDKISEIEQVKIEYAPKPKGSYLNDNTSFDTYIEYKHVDNNLGFIGIEVKYTEQEYDYTEKEKADIYNPSSTYNRLTRRIGIYQENCLEKLKTPKYKQVWRNQLLGESILEKDTGFKHFTSIIIFPAGNHHFVDVCNSYSRFLKEGFRSKFIGITYEDFIQAGNYYCTDSKQKSWLEYLKSRYLITD